MKVNRIVKPKTRCSNVFWTCLAFTFFLLSLYSCNSKQTNIEEVSSDVQLDSIAKQTLLKAMIRSEVENKAVNDSLIKAYEKTEDYENNIYYWTSKASKYYYGFKNDSLLRKVESIDIPKSKPDEWVLKQALLLKSKSSYMDINSSEVLGAMIKARNEAEKLKSVFIYRLDNLIAMSYYTNNDSENSLKYLELYKSGYPYAGHPRYRQVYYDIRFMLSLNLPGNPGTKDFLDSCQSLAIELNDTLALMRSYDFEAQWLLRNGKKQEALDKARIFFQYASETKNYTNLKRYYNFSNLFLVNNQPDSAIKYIKEGFQLDSLSQANTKDLDGIYYVLGEAYAMKGDFKRAYEYGRKEINTFRKSTETIQKTAIAELTARYDAEKKDEAISALQANNDLNDKLIVQQRWTFIIFLVLAAFVAYFVFNSYKQKLFKAEHERLRLSNKQLLLEQKNRQNQLNPHFIYNSIANLQGLISTDRKQEANQYLVTLTKVIRDMLELNRKDFIPIDKEIRSLENYVNLQQMRFSHSFDFKVETGELEIDNILIPPMLIQPFVENAIEHGLMNLEQQGRLTVEFVQDNKTLRIKIVDNGKGGVGFSTKSGEKESLSQVITQERIELLYGRDPEIAGLKIYPHFNPDGTGYKVEIYLPLTLYFD